MKRNAGYAPNIVNRCTCQRGIDAYPVAFAMRMQDHVGAVWVQPRLREATEMDSHLLRDLPEKLLEVLERHDQVPPSLGAARYVISIRRCKRFLWAI